MAYKRAFLNSISIVTLMLSATYAQTDFLETSVWPTDKFIERDLFKSAYITDKTIVLKYLRLTLDALMKSMTYLDTHLGAVNLDGIIGPRQTESKLGYMVSKYWTVLPPEVSRAMKEILILAGKIGEKGIPIVKSATPQYYENSYPLIDPHFYDLYFPARPINTSLIEIFSERTKAFTEKESDDCLTEFFGNKGGPKCKISGHCWNLMIGRRQLHYSLTHEVFYLLNGIQANCIEELSLMAKLKNRTTVVKLLDYFCANVYKEALDIEKSKFEKGIRDLFMEQIGLCGDAGYVEIAQWRWLKLILSWQRPNGCFGLFKDELMDPRNFDPNQYGKMKRSTVSVRRVKRTEQLMSPDGCLSHRVSVAISALNTYVRRLIGHYIGETI